ncbi:DUF4249 domain-containing protein [Chitinophaga filiformis]|uniref:DUF4249 domain-containing protein n=1 Tax=Chitinophaga filiformis TaxID=104663 RepID=UPI001F3EBAE7|nr:DUF4249 domain-containing protein [Chitinophaga filiformis]MCF6406521.1 DUF4249 domain-containing protein [Chitinophaga filiformis]
MRPFSLYAILLIIVIAACQKESRMPIPYDGDKVVLNSLIQPDSLIYIRVTKSKPVKEYGNLRFPELQGAAVVIQENGMTLPAPEWRVINGRGYYVSQGVAGTGKQYTVSVSYTGLTSVEATDSTPSAPDIRDASAQIASNRIKFSLKDNIAEKNYYRIRVYNADTVNGQIVPLKRDTVKFRLDPLFNNSFIDVIGNAYYSEVLLTDDRINGKDVLFVLQTSKEVTASHMIVEVSGLTRGAYKYLDGTYSQRLEERLDFSMDPVNVYSNVENGYGILGGVNAKRLSFSVE